MGDRRHPTDDDTSAHRSAHQTLGDKLQYLGRLDPSDVNAIEILVDDAIARHEEERRLARLLRWRHGGEPQ